jgi:hypothetical protein
VIDGAIPVRKRPAGRPAVSRSGPGKEESQTRRAHRQRMKAFLRATRSVA